MNRWVSPPLADGRYSNGWTPQLLVPWVVFGNGRVDVLEAPRGRVQALTHPAGARQWPAGLHAEHGQTILGLTIETPAEWTREFALVTLETGATRLLPIDPSTMPVYYANGRVWGYRAAGRPDADWQYFRDGVAFAFAAPGRLAGPPRGVGKYLVLSQPDRGWLDVVLDGETGAVVDELPARGAVVVPGPDGRYASFVRDGANVVRRLTDGVELLFPLVVGADWQGTGVPAWRHGQLWLWTPCAGGLNEQCFAFGRTLDGDPRGICVEMPAGPVGADGHLQVDHIETTDTWWLAGMAQGLHGTPDYRDGELHVITDLSADTARVDLRTQIVPFNFPIRIPSGLTCDVWTFGDIVPGTIGGGLSSGRPQRQGIGLWSASDEAQGGGKAGTAWLNVDDPNTFGVWLSPHDAAQGLRTYVDGNKQLTPQFDLLATQHGLADLRLELVALAQAALDRGTMDFWPVERRIGIELCRRYGYHAVLYSDHQPYSDDTKRGYFDLRDELRALKAAGIAVCGAVNLYPTGVADWAQLHMAEDVVAEGVPLVLTLGLYTQRDPFTGRMSWQPTAVARSLETALRAATHLNAICVDVFGVGRRGEHPEFEPWARRWLQALLATRPPCDRSRYPATAIAERPVDCVVSDWGAWTVWTADGPTTESRRRARTVLVEPRAGGAACGPVFDTEVRPRARPKKKSGTPMTKKEKQIAGAAAAGGGLFVVLAKLFGWF